MARRNKKPFCVPDAVIAELKSQVAKYHHATWEDIRYFSSSEEETWKHDLWTAVVDMDDFQVGDFFLVPFCTVADGGEPIATHNLEVVKEIEYQQAVVKVYKKVNPAQSGYLIYLGDDANPPVLFECK